jgi:S-adenosylmethionine hydrolase
MIALLTDFGWRDAYVAQMKGVIVGLNPEACLCDLTHDVGQFDIRAAAYVLEASTKFLPADTIVVAVVDPGVGTRRRPIAVQTRAHKWFVGPDNGLFTRVIHHEEVAAAFTLTNAAYFRTPQISATFHGRDIFAPVAAHLSLGVPASHFGPAVSDLVLLPQALPQVEERVVSGEIVYIDHFGNIITNIPATMLPACMEAGRVAVTVPTGTYTVPYVQTYAEAPPQQVVALRNSDDLVELAVNQGSAAQRVPVEVGTRVVLRPAVEEVRCSSV